MSTQSRKVGERYSDARNLPRTSAFWIKRANGDEEAVLMPPVLPSSYEASRSLLIRLGVAVYDVAKQYDPMLAAADEAEVAKFMVREYAKEFQANEAGRSYINRYDTIVNLAELALSRGMPEQGPKPLATVTRLDAHRERVPVVKPDAAIIPLPRAPFDSEAIPLANA
jgi:hypothetical protein